MSTKQDKATTERHARILREMLKRPENKVCADCKRNGEPVAAICPAFINYRCFQIRDGPPGICELQHLSQLEKCAKTEFRGCFVCIRCSGIHRSMGTHISKVKSVDLDTWTPEQMEVSELI